MGIVLKGKKEIEAYISINGELDIRNIALVSLEHLLKEEKLSIKDVSEIFHEDEDAVMELLARNGII